MPIRYVYRPHDGKRYATSKENARPLSARVRRCPGPSLEYDRSNGKGRATHREADRACIAVSSPSQKDKGGKTLVAIKKLSSGWYQIDFRDRNHERHRESFATK